MQYRIASKDEWAALRGKLSSADTRALFDAGKVPVFDDHRRTIRVLAPGSTIPRADAPIVTRELVPSVSKTSREDEIARARLDPNVSAEAFRALLGMPPAAPAPGAKTEPREASASAYAKADADLTRAWHDAEKPAPRVPRAMPPTADVGELAARAWDEGDGTAADHARLAETRAEKRAAAARAELERRQPPARRTPIEAAIDLWNRG